MRFWNLYERKETFFPLKWQKSPKIFRIYFSFISSELHIELFWSRLKKNIIKLCFIMLVLPVWFKVYWRIQQLWFPNWKCKYEAEKDMRVISCWGGLGILGSAVPTKTQSPASSHILLYYGLEISAFSKVYHSCF